MDHRHLHDRAPWFILVLVVSLALPLTGCYTKRTLVVEPSSRPGDERSANPGLPPRSAPPPSSVTRRPDTSAREFLLAWHFERGLPGLGKGTPGSLEETLRVHPNETDRPRPASKVFRFTPDNEPTHYFYAVQPTDSSWQLTQAWKTDPAGKLIQQLELK